MRRLLIIWALLLTGIVCISQSEAFYQSRDSNYNIAIASGGGTTTFDATDVGTGITLSGGNLIATYTGSTDGAYVSVRSAASHSTGKFYWEINVTNNGGTGGNIAVGIMNGSFNTSTDDYIGGTANAGGAFGNASTLFINGTGFGTTPAYGVEVVGIAIDAGAQLFWLREISAPTVWNAGGTANPATGVGGISFSTITGTGPYYAAVSLSNGLDNISVTGNFGGSTFGASAPAGFVNY